MQHNENFPSNERALLLRSMSSHSDEGRPPKRVPPRRVSTVADEEGIRQSFTIHHHAFDPSQTEYQSIRERVKLWIEVNAFLLGMMILSTSFMFLLRLKGGTAFGVTYTIAASPLVLGLVKFALAVLDPIVFGVLSYLETIFSWHIRVLVASSRLHVQRILLLTAMYYWFLPHDEDRWITNLFEAGAISATLWLAKDILIQFARRFLIVSSMTEMIRAAGFERDAIVMLCCPEERDRAYERAQWDTDSDRSSLTSKLNAIREGALDLPLQPVGETDVATWKYSTETMVRIQSVHQMRIIAAVLRDNLFEGGRRPTITYDHWCNIIKDAPLADRTWESLFQGSSPSPVQSLTGKDFVWGIFQAFERRKRMTSHLMNLSNMFTVMGSVATSIGIFFVISIVATRMGATFSQVIVTCSTSFVALSFALAGTITRVFESIVFILVMKPFEIGDRITFDGEDYFVDQINMMSTVMRKTDQRVMQISNTVLATKAIYNHRRSGPATLDIRFMISYETMGSKLQHLKDVIREYVKLNSDIWKPEVEFLVQDLDGDTAVTLTARCHHRLTWQEKVALDEHRFDLAECLRQGMNQLEISTSASDSVVCDLRPVVPGAPAA